MQKLQGNNLTEAEITEGLRLAAADQLGWIELVQLFEKLDDAKRYNELVDLIFMYPGYMLHHFEMTHEFFTYNLLADKAQVKSLLQQDPEGLKYIRKAWRNKSTLLKRVLA
jgi:hypothetical protein